MNVEYISFAIGSSLLRVNMGYLAALDARPSSDGRFRRLLLAPGESSSPSPAAPASAAPAASFELQTDVAGLSDYVLRVAGLDVCYIPDAIGPILRVFELPPKESAPEAASANLAPPILSLTDSATISQIPNEIGSEEAPIIAFAGTAATVFPQVTYHVFLVGVTLTVVEAAGAAGPANARRATAATSVMLKHTRLPNGMSIGRMHVQDAVLGVSGSGIDGGRAARPLFGRPVSLSLDYELPVDSATKATLQGGEIEVTYTIC